MPTYPTPFGPIEAPDEAARDKFIAKEQANRPQQPQAPQPGTPPQPGQSSAAQPQQAQEPPGGAMEAAWQGLLQGGGNVAKGAGQMMGQMGMPGMPSRMDMSKRENAWGMDPTRRAHPIAAATGEVLGEMGATAPLGLAGRVAGPIRNMLTGAATGAAGGAMSPVTGGDYWTEKAKQMGGGAVVGGGVGLAGGAMAPRLTPEAQMLADRGVRLTPGQAGGWAESERMMQAWPIMRNYVRGLAGRSQDDYNRATVSQALEPLGTVVPRNVAAGHDLMTFARNQFNQAYGRVLPHVNLDGAGTASALAHHPEYQRLLSEMAPEDATRLTNIVNNRVHDLIARNGGRIDGQVFKTMEEDLGRRAATFAGTNSNEIGQGLRQALGVIREELANQNPTYAPVLQRINHAYSMFDRVRDAAARNATSEGRFTPSDMLQALRGDDASAGRGAWGRGTVPMQVLAEAAQGVIGQSGPLALRHRENITGVLKDFAGGALMPLPYAAAQAGLAGAPVIGRGMAAATPTAGMEAGKALAGSDPIGKGQIRRYSPPEDSGSRPGVP